MAKEAEEDKPKKKVTKAVEASPKKAAPKEAVPKKVATEESLAKAGKRSSKGVKAQAEKKVKEERKKDPVVEENKNVPKPALKATRSKLERRGKKYRETAKLIEKGKNYSLEDGIQLAVKTSPTKFDASVELHVNLNVDPRHADQNVRGIVVLPAGSGKVTKVAVLAEDDKASAAEKAGADLVGLDNIFALLDKEQLDFNILIATPSLMPRLGKYAKILGPKGLMPNPKSGTVTDNVVQAVEQAKAGRVEYRVDSTGIMHLAIGKVSFGAEKIKDNIDAVFAGLRANKPASVKGTFIKSAHVTTTMGPGISLDLSTLS